MNPVLLRRLALGTLSFCAVLVTGLFLFVKGEPGPSANLEAYLVDELSAFSLNEPAGDPVPTAFETETGEVLSLEDFKGKYVLLNLWATWCAPCLVEMPTLDRLKADMEGDDFTVLAVSVDRGGLEKPKQFLDRTGATHLDLLVDQTGKLNFNYHAYQLPTTLLLDRKGREIGRLTGKTEWDSDTVKRFIRALIKSDKKGRQESS